MYIDLEYTSLHFLYGKTLIKECWMIQSWWHLYTMFLCILNIRGRK